MGVIALDASAVRREISQEFQALYSVLLVSSFRLIREAMRVLIESHEGFKVIGETDDTGHTLQALGNLRPDVIVMDLDPDHAVAVETMRAVIKHRPGIKIIVLSKHLEHAIVGNVLRAGARGFVSKASSSSELVEALTTVARGQAYLSPVVAAQVMEWVRSGKPQGERHSALEFLTEREIQVLRLLAEGKVNKEVAAALDLGVETVRSYRKSLMKKLQIHNVAELMRFAVLAGVITIEPKDPGGVPGSGSQSEEDVT